VPLLEQVLERYPKDVKIVFKNFPLRNHAFAWPAAVAAAAAARQGKFWQFHDRVFERYNKLSEQELRDIAVSLELDMDRFEADRKDPQIQAQVSDDARDGQQSEVRGTPTVFVNGRLLQSRDLAGFQQMIEEQLRRTRSKGG
jgi:protein-disulfide isomerase